MLITHTRINTKFVDDEAQAVIVAVRAIAKNPASLDSEFLKVSNTEGYKRLRQREESMGRPFEDSAFKLFLTSKELTNKLRSIESTLRAWKKSNLDRCAEQALTYLPADARIKAKIYPVIKPKSNSFVFDTDKDPAIFLSINPDEDAAQFRNVVTHELHHIGYASCCPSPVAKASIDRLDKCAQKAVEWIAAFGEGLAMLAAAGSPDVHPHSVGPIADKNRWDNDMKNCDKDLREVERFFMQIIDGKLKDKDADEKGMEYFGIQGPWYTVGYKLAVAVEKKFGRKELINCMLDMRNLLKRYNETVADDSSAARWSESFLSKIGV